MKKTSISWAVFALALLVVAINFAAPSCVASTPLAPEPSKNEPSAVELQDHVLGRNDAPVTIIEYASYTCSHCSHFYRDVMPQIEKNFVDTGKVRFIYRSFPSNRYDLAATALTHCVSPDQYYPLVQTFFSNADAWMPAPKPEKILMQYAALAGLDITQAESCIKNTALLDAIVARRTKAIKMYEISATPTFIINESEDKIIGALSYEEFAARINKILNKK